MADYKCPFEVGDMVTPIEPDDWEKTSGYGPGWNTEMNRMVGRMYPVYKIYEQPEHYHIEIGETPSERWWTWKDNWLQPVQSTDYTLF